MISDSDINELQKLAKERTVKTQAIEYDLETLVKKIDKGKIRLDPDYQRRRRWDNATKSRLIESLILNIPIPIIYISLDFDVDTETEDARYSVIDGQQRLFAIYSYFSNQFKLEGLKSLSLLNGLFYKDLPVFLIRRLEERTIKCLRIDSTIDPQVKIDIFERLNSGSVRLESQELRNAVYRGPFNDVCKELSQNSNFRALLQIDDNDPESSAKVQKMEDVELVLRFYALKDDKYYSFKKSKFKSFKEYLDRELNFGNSMNQNELNLFRKDFVETINIVITNFGDRAFAKYVYEKGKFREQSRFNAAVYDALIVSIYSEVYRKGITKISDQKIKSYKELFKNKEFHESVSGSILDSSKIVYRIDETRRIFQV